MKKYGTYVSTKVRKAMFELLFEMVMEKPELITSEHLIGDILKLIRKTTGRIEAESGEHDDTVMAYLNALYIYFSGDNLDEEFSGRIFSLKLYFQVKQKNIATWQDIGVLDFNVSS